MTQENISGDHSPILQVNQLSQQRAQELILDKLSFSLKAGEIAILIGPSGGGQSTLVRLLNRLDEPKDGEILLHGKDIRQLPPVELRLKVAMMLQKPIMFSGTVLENLQSSFRLRRKILPTADSEKIQQVVAFCGLDSALLQRDAAELSVGQQQRVSLARALLTTPEVLLLDEPTSALDRPSADRLGELLQRLCREQGVAVFLATHDLRLAERIADRILFLQGGQVIEEGGVEILRRAKTRELQGFLSDPQLTHQCQEQTQ